jgi:hypothetical protein
MKAGMMFFKKIYTLAISHFSFLLAILSVDPTLKNKKWLVAGET